MDSSYAVYWNEGAGARFAGRLDLEPGCAQLAGRTARGGRTLVRVLFGDITSVWYGRGRLHVERRAEPALEIGSVDGPGALHELADRLRAAALPA
jgi:hypothetical protein